MPDPALTCRRPRPATGHERMIVCCSAQVSQPPAGALCRGLGWRCSHGGSLRLLRSDDGDTGANECKCLSGVFIHASSSFSSASTWAYVRPVSRGGHSRGLVLERVSGKRRCEGYGREWRAAVLCSVRAGVTWLWPPVSRAPEPRAHAWPAVALHTTHFFSHIQRESSLLCREKFSRVNGYERTKGAKII
eukprot:2980232-Rhodomonas_salina.1